MAMGLTSPFGLGRAISLEEEKRVAATSGNIPLANAEQAEKRPSAVSSFSSRILKCSKRQPLGPAPDPRGACLIESKSNDLNKVIDSQLTLGGGGELKIWEGVWRSTSSPYPQWTEPDRYWLEF